MCGRYSLTETPSLEQRFLAEIAEQGWLTTRYNIAPTQDVPVVVQALHRDRPGRTIERMRWGLVPFWSKDTKTAYRLINIRAESFSEKRTFQPHLRSKRCLVPATGFFEWRREGKKRRPYYVRVRGEQLFAFAGIRDRWRGPDGAVVDSCSIVTVPANELVATIHDRMPAILPEEAEGLWLDPARSRPEELLPLLQPFPARSMEMYEVGPAVNSVRNESPELLTPVAEPS